MEIKDFYEKLNGDFQDACERLFNPGMVDRFVRKFPSDPSMQQLRDAVKEGDIEAQFRAVHTLKSVAGVLSFTPLFKAAWALTEQLRPRLNTADAILLEILEQEYRRTISLLSEYISG